MKPEILKSNLLRPGKRFIATEEVKDTTFPPYTMGFFAYFRTPDRDYQDVGYAKVSIIRRGKNGQERVEIKEISFPIFTDKRMFEHEDYLPRGRKYYIHIEESPIDLKSVLDFEIMDYLGWSTAYVSYLKYLTKSYVSPAKRAIWSNDTVPRQLVSAGRIPSLFNENPEQTKMHFGTAESRVDFVMAARQLESKLTKCICSYKKSALASVLNSSHFVVYTNENYYEVADKKLAENTVSFYKEKYKRVEELVQRNNHIMAKRRN
jgi:hypothetical protein